MPRCWATSVLSHSFSQGLNPSWEASQSVINNFLKQPYPGHQHLRYMSFPLEETCGTSKSRRRLGVCRKRALTNFTSTFFTSLCILTFHLTPSSVWNLFWYIISNRNLRSHFHPAPPPTKKMLTIFFVIILFWFNLFKFGLTYLNSWVINTYLYLNLILCFLFRSSELLVTGGFNSARLHNMF